RRYRRQGRRYRVVASAGGRRGLARPPRGAPASAPPRQRRLPPAPCPLPSCRPAAPTVGTVPTVATAATVATVYSPHSASRGSTATARRVGTQVASSTTPVTTTETSTAAVSDRPRPMGK